MRARFSDNEACPWLDRSTFGANFDPHGAMNDDGDVLTGLRRTLKRHQTLAGLAFSERLTFFGSLQLGAPAHHADRCLAAASR